jgi:hypothetical protein
MSLLEMMQKALNLPQSATHEDAVKALAERMNPPSPKPTVQVSDDPQERFEQLSELTARVKGISLADAYALVSRENPEMWEQARRRAMI